MSIWEGQFQVLLGQDRMLKSTYFQKINDLFDMIPQRRIAW